MPALSKKICLLGEFGVGKTSLVRRFIYERFDDKYISTIGVKVSRKTVLLPQNNGLPSTKEAGQVGQAGSVEQAGHAGEIELTMLLWDLAGSEEFNSVRASYLRGAAGAVLVCDVTRPETLRALKQYATDLFHVSPNAQVAIAANKIDLVQQRAINTTEVAMLAGQIDAPFLFTSAKVGDQVNTLFRNLALAIV